MSPRAVLPVRDIPLYGRQQTMFGPQYQDDARSFLQGNELEGIAASGGRADDQVKHITVTLRSGHVFDFPVSQGSLSAMLLETETLEPSPLFDPYEKAARVITAPMSTRLKVFVDLRPDPKKPSLYTMTLPHECPAPLVVPGIENGPALLYAVPGKDGAPPTLTDVLTEPGMPEHARLLAPLVLASLAPPVKPRKRKRKKVHA